MPVYGLSRGKPTLRLIGHPIFAKDVDQCTIRRLCSHSTRVYSKVDDNVALGFVLRDVTDTNVTDVSLVLDRLKIVRERLWSEF